MDDYASSRRGPARTTGGDNVPIWFSKFSRRCVKGAAALAAAPLRGSGAGWSGWDARGGAGEARRELAAPSGRGRGTLAQREPGKHGLQIDRRTIMDFLRLIAGAGCFRVLVLVIDEAALLDEVAALLEGIVGVHFFGLRRGDGRGGRSQACGRWHCIDNLFHPLFRLLSVEFSNQLLQPGHCGLLRDVALFNRVSLR